MAILSRSCCRTDDVVAAAPPPLQLVESHNGDAYYSMRNNKSRRLKSETAAAHWQSDLPVISEDVIVASVVQGESKIIVKKKPVRKVRPAVAKDGRYSAENFDESRLNDVLVVPPLPLKEINSRDSSSTKLKSETAEHWWPALPAIFEGGIVQKKSSCKARPAMAKDFTPCGCCDEPRRNSILIIIPAFSPTPIII